MKRLLTYKQVAELIQAPISTAYALVSQGRMPHLKIGPRFIRFDEEEILQWLDSKKSSVQEGKNEK